MLPLIQPSVDMLGIAAITLMLSILAIAGCAVTVRAIGIVKVE